MIVTDFFKTYFSIINNSVGKESKEIIYIDLFCGPGVFDSDQPSTPMVLLDLINKYENDDIRNKLRIVFNDEDSKNIKKLKSLIENHEVVSKLKHPPEISNKCARDVDIKVHTFKKCPIFSFIDPWGYKDVSVTQTWDLVENIGSDCVLFFNSNRFIMDINKKTLHCHLEPIFGNTLPEVITLVNDDSFDQKKKAQRIVELFSMNLIREKGKSHYNGYRLFVLPFGFEADDKEKISHHILFITKNHKAITEMKKVMVKHANSNDTQFTFDSKESLQISMFHRNDLVIDGITKTLKEFMATENKNFAKTWKVDILLESLDHFYMTQNYLVTPYLRNELKDTIEYLYNRGLIEVILPPNKKISKIITFEREFKIREELLV